VVCRYGMTWCGIYRLPVWNQCPYREEVGLGGGQARAGLAGDVGVAAREGLEPFLGSGDLTVLPRGGRGLGMRR
jgi:hypothetical protein